MKLKIKKLSAVDEVTNKDLIKKYQLAFVMCCIAYNNIHWIHWHIKGRKFDNIHNLCDEYYEELSKDQDFLAELLMQHQIPLINPIDTNNVVPEAGLVQTELNYEEAIAAIAYQLTVYIGALQELSDSLTGDENRVDQSAIDNILCYWKKEVYYKMNHRSDSIEMGDLKDPVEEVKEFAASITMEQLFERMFDAKNTPLLEEKNKFYLAWDVKDSKFIKWDKKGSEEIAIKDSDYLDGFLSELADEYNLNRDKLVKDLWDSLK